MDRMEKEFTDIDDGVVADEDLFSSLKKVSLRLNLQSHPYLLSRPHA